MLMQAAAHPMSNFAFVNRGDVITPGDQRHRAIAVLADQVGKVRPVDDLSLWLWSDDHSLFFNHPA